MIRVRTVLPKFKTISGWLNQRKSRTTATSLTTEKDKDESAVKSYEDIPGPKGLPLIGNIFRFLPYVGEYSNVSMLGQLQLLRNTYGSIVKMGDIPNRRPNVFLFDPDLCEKMYRSQGVWPRRVAMESLLHYRASRKCIYGGQLGLTVSQGKEWHDFRSKVNPHMMHPRVVTPHIPQINDIAEEFVDKMREIRDPTTLELPPSFNNELNKWALEAACSIALDHRLGCLKSNLATDSEPQIMINCIHEMFELLYNLEIMPAMWKFYMTPNLKRLFSGLDTLNGIAIKYINRAKEKFYEKRSNDAEENSILEKLLRVDEQTALVMSLDILTAGVDTTGNSSAALLYYLATNPSKQAKLREEACRLLPMKSSPITKDTLAQVPYLRACIKESLRLFPVAIGNLRTMPTDVILDGYKIPAGSDLVAPHAVFAVDQVYFPRPTEYIPERWLKENTGFPSAKDAHRFAYMPFGFGSRTCIGRRFAELELEILALKMVRNFKMEWHHGPLEYQSRFINIVTTPMELKLNDF